MKITYLGTAAAEGFPALFCNCEYCREAKKLGGKNIRTRSQSLINENLLIDFPPDSYMHFLREGIDGHKIEYVLFTHVHRDHFYIDDLSNRHAPFAHAMDVKTLKIFCPSTVYDAFDSVPENVELTRLEPYKTVSIGEYRITPLPAKHAGGTEAFIYIIDGDKTLLYAHDTGYFYDEVFEYIKSHGVKLDMISLDCTNVDIPISDDGVHMGFPNIKRVLERLWEIGAVSEKTIKYVNHFSHNGNPLHENLEKKAFAIGCLVSYDGCCVEL